MGSREIRTVLSHEDPTTDSHLLNCHWFEYVWHTEDANSELSNTGNCSWISKSPNSFLNRQSWLLQCEPDSRCAPGIRISILGQQQLTALASLHRPGAWGLVPVLCTVPSTCSRIQKLHGLEHLVPAQSNLCNSIGKLCVLLSLHSLNYYLAHSKL